MMMVIDGDDDDDDDGVPSCILDFSWTVTKRRFTLFVPQVLLVWFGGGVDVWRVALINEAANKLL